MYINNSNDELTKRIFFPSKLLPFLPKNTNSVICPYGIITVLSMAAEGASEESLQEILTALGFDTLQELHESVLAIQDYNCTAFSSDNSFMVKYDKDKTELLPNFRKIMKDCYNAKISERTSNGEAYLGLKNVANFKAEWFYTMERNSSHEELFQNADGSTCHPAFLSLTEEFLCYYDDYINFRPSNAVKAVALPYKIQDNRIPYELVLVDSQEPLTKENLTNILGNMRLRKCKVIFPEFSIKSKHNLIPMMESLGLKNIFDKYNEAFDKIATVPLYAEQFNQEAEIEVDKNGTIAKAVTTMLFAKTVCLQKKIDELIFNKPFQYFLRNTTTGEIIFMGKVNKLTDCKKEKPAPSGLALFPFGNLKEQKQ